VKLRNIIEYVEKDKRMKPKKRTLRPGIPRKPKHALRSGK